MAVVTIKISRIDSKLMSDHDSMIFWQKEGLKVVKSQFQTFEGAGT